MKELIETFPNQIRDALAIFRSTTLKPASGEIRNVLITGLGGSGIGGTIASEICNRHAGIPVNVSKDYFIPAYVDKHTLVIISSYSGNTEETLSAMRQAMDTRAKIIAICSGGQVAEIAHQNNYDLLLIPSGNPPRACLAYSLTLLLGVLDFFGVAKNTIGEAELAADLLDQNRDAIVTEAEAIARTLSFSTPVLVTGAGYEGVAIRFRQQLNENAKMLCWHAVVPEMNHNELVGWADKQPKLAAIFMRNSDEFYRNSKRFEITRSVIFEKAGKTIDLHSKGQSYIQRIYYWIFLGDWISWFASVERGQDSMEIKVIDRLKNELQDLE